MSSGRLVKSFSYGRFEEQIVTNSEKLAKREGLDLSKLIVKALREYLENHKEGNPQTPLIPGEPLENLDPVGRRREKLEWIKELVAKNPGVDEVALATRFAEETGLRLETVKEYVCLLVRSRGILKKGSSLYPSGRDLPATK